MPAIPASLCLMLASTVALVLDDQPYCSMRYRRLCLGKGRHIACQYPNPGPGEFCQNYTQILFTRELKHFVTNYINRRRQRLAAGNERVRGGAHLPRPSMMMQVEWDREIALLAQRLADQCTFVHDDCRATVRYPYAGQTVGEVRWRRYSESDELSALRAIRRVLDAWWGERRRVQVKQITAPFRLTARGTTWGHFSQLAVWTLRAVGCGAVRHGNEYPRLLLVCDFSHTNMLGQRTISPGPLTQCPVHTVRKPRSSYPLLCAPVRHHSFDYAYKSEEAEYDSTEDDDDFEDNEVDLTTKPPIDLTVTTTSELLPKTTAGEDLTFSHRNVEYDRTALEDTTFKALRGYMIDKLQHELDHRIVGARKTVVWTKLPYFEEESDNQERTLKANRKFIRYQTIKAERTRQSTTTLHYRHTGRPPHTEETDPTEGYYSPVRQRWKHTRDRPLRPGANALLATKTPETPLPKKAVAKIFLNMDKDVEDQLFHDTGFKAQRRQ